MDGVLRGVVEGVALGDRVGRVARSLGLGAWRDGVADGDSLGAGSGAGACDVSAGAAGTGAVTGRSAAVGCRESG
ncbi:hypothetical protein [Streptomyces sp. AC627_RSS907]|uniref:hypothetical protein n=1 Tax=Streptomyces sp. AC627_RSS907 TaxID=2823684 RepID=UPI001C244D32|nr:hypothetical protein [Streptomyces sp. AC627_RSS907]